MYAYFTHTLIIRRAPEGLNTTFFYARGLPPTKPGDGMNNMWQSGLLTNLLSNEIPRLCRSVPELVAVLTRLCNEVSALRETIADQERISEKPSDE